MTRNFQSNIKNDGNGNGNGSSRSSSHLSHPAASRGNGNVGGRPQLLSPSSFFMSSMNNIMTTSPMFTMGVVSTTNGSSEDEGLSREEFILKTLEEVEELLNDDFEFFPTSSSSLSSTTAHTSTRGRVTRTRRTPRPFDVSSSSSSSVSTNSSGDMMNGSIRCPETKQ